jgi:CRISPR type IV-associated protein Csf3
VQTLRITAELYSGFASSDPWSPTIDGIIAYWHLQDALGSEQFALNTSDPARQHPVEGLPLEVVRWRDWWWYACSLPIYEQAAEVTRYMHRRFDAQHAERYLDLQGKSGRILTAAGPYKNRRLGIRHHVTDRVQWYAVGDAAEVERLLLRCGNIGMKYGAGFGRVRRWLVEPIVDDPDDRAYRYRPLPVEYATEIGVTGSTIEYGLRPPARIAENRTLCVIPPA